LGTAETRQQDFNGKSANNKWEKSANKIRRKNLQQSLELVFCILFTTPRSRGKILVKTAKVSILAYQFCVSYICCM